jgi:ADP-heptose:LPS heptosyltransferase
VPTADPGREIPDLLIATAASLPEKLWPIEKWIEVLKGFKGSIGLLGAKPSEQGKHWKGADEEAKLLDIGVQDLRGTFTLPQVVGALANTRAVLTIDNGILHLATAAGTHTVGLFRHGIHRLWAPPFDNLQVLTPGEGREVWEIEVEAVQEALRRAL